MRDYQFVLFAMKQFFRILAHVQLHVQFWQCQLLEAELFAVLGIMISYLSRICTTVSCFNA